LPNIFWNVGVDYFGPVINMKLTLLIIVDYGEFWLIVVVKK